MAPGAEPSSRELEGKAAVVTGAAIGVGRAIAAELALAGARVVIADVRGADEAVRSLAEAGAEAISVEADVTSPEALAGLAAATVEAFGGADILVNNAGLFGTLEFRPFTEIPLVEWRQVGVAEHIESFAAMHARTSGAPVLRRDMAPSDVVGAVRFLAGPWAAFKTGQNIVVDGGAVFH